MIEELVWPCGWPGKELFLEKDSVRENGWELFALKTSHHGRKPILKKPELRDQLRAMKATNKVTGLQGKVSCTARSRTYVTASVLMLAL